MDQPHLTMFFIVEPPTYQNMACYLAASIRAAFGQSVAMVGYCPAHRLPEVSPEVITVLSRMGCAVRPFTAEGRFDPPYPHGNKLLAALEPRETEFSAFLDSDILFLRPNDVGNLVKDGHVSLTPAASMVWGGQAEWERIYATCGMELPSERIRLMNQRYGGDRIPYFSSGLFVFPEQHRNAQGKRFPEVWMEMAQTIDADPDIPKKRPYLDQMSLPLAIRKAGLDWNILPKEQHFILGGMKRGEPLPQEPQVFTVHYRKWDVLRETGLARQAKDMLQQQAGVRRMAQVSKAGTAAEAAE